MGRKQITYAHKRNRNRTHVPKESNSSPLEDISDPEQYLTHPEMARRILKRSRRSGSVSISLNRSQDYSQRHSYKKLRMSAPGEREQEKSLIFPLNDNYNLQTPHPTQLTKDQVFKLESSRGLPLSPDHEFSPVPLAPLRRSFSPAPSSKPIRKTKTHGDDGLSRRTSSRSLKENMAARNSRSSSKLAPKPTASRRNTRSRSRAEGFFLPLASPFTSQPSSPYTNPSQDLHTQTITKPTKVTTNTIIYAKRTLSDTHYNPNLPQVQSTANSPARPARDAEAVKMRRPSAPTIASYRPDVASWFVSPSNQGGAVKADTSFNMMRSPTIFDLGSGSGGRALNVDFNRPPSQLSFTAAYDENFFGDAQGASTPFGFKSQKQVQRYEYVDPMVCYSSEDEEDQYVPHPVPYPSPSHPDPNTDQNKLDKSTSILKVPLEREYSTWITDSLISVPTALRAYSRSTFLDHYGDGNLDEQVQDDDDGTTTLGLGPSFGLDLGPCFEDTLLRCDGLKNSGLEESAEGKAETLKGLFEGLEIASGGTGSRPAFARSRSLDMNPSPRSPEPNSSSNQGEIQVPRLESPAFISPSKAKGSSNVSANKRRTRDRRGTIRASDFVPVPVGGVGGGARRTRSGTVVGPAWNRRERSGTVVAAAPTGLATISRMAGNGNCDGVDGGEADIDMQSQGSVHDTDKQMSDTVAANSRRGAGVGREEVEADPMNIVGPWRDEDWPWTVAEPPSPVLVRRTKAEKRKREPGFGLGLGLPKGWELWQMREHDEDDWEDDPLNILG